MAGVNAYVGGAPGPVTCPLCGTVLTRDPLGFVECGCGWGGKGDPLETERGPARLVTRIDRDLANTQAFGDLRRLAANGDSATDLSVLYVAALLLVATLIYIALVAALAGLIFLFIGAVTGGVWIAALLCALLIVLVGYALTPPLRRPRGVFAAPARFPQLAAALDDVAKRVGTRAPDRVLLLPGSGFAVYQHHPLRRFFRAERVLVVGAASLSILTDVEARSIIAHELAHFSSGDHLFHPYVSGAERAMTRLLTVIGEGASLDKGGLSPYANQLRARTTLGAFGAFGAVLVAIVTWTALLPFRILAMLFHLLRLRESRSSEFAADRVAIHAYGAVSFINALSGILVAQRTLRGSLSSLRQEMLKHNSGNIYAELRRHYAELPPHLLAGLRVEAAQEFRSLDRTHPIAPDRLRAAYNLIAFQPPLSAPPVPASTLLAQQGEQTPDAIERELTALLFKRG